jgi:hypothetical protein
MIALIMIRFLVTGGICVPDGRNAGAIYQLFNQLLKGNIGLTIIEPLSLTQK